MGLDMNPAIETKCPHCGASMKSYWHKLTPGLVEVLKTFSAAIKKKGTNNIHVPKDCPLTSSQYNNFQKLRYHGLIAKYKENGLHISGHWSLTSRGVKFLKGEIAVPISVRTFRNRVEEYDPEQKHIYEIDRTEKYYETIDTIQSYIVYEEVK